MGKSTTIVTATALALLGLQPAHAGRPCEPRSLNVASLQRGLELARNVAARLDGSAAEVVVLGRVGQDLARYGLHYSHLGYAYRDTASGAWRVVHKLNQCGSDRAALYRQGLGEFFLDGLHEYEAGFVVPAPEVQARLLKLLRDNREVRAMHTPAYSMVAYPWAQRYQQSNQWAIETLAHAMEPAAATRAQAQAWLVLKGYRPATLRLSPLERLGARINSANVAFDDHPAEKRFSDRIETVTADSVFSWLTQSGLSGPLEVVR